MHSDVHVISQMKEAVQILCTVVRKLGIDHPNLCAPTHPEHPATVWAGETPDNFAWTYELAFALNVEYQLRSKHGEEHSMMWQADEAWALYKSRVRWRTGMTAWAQVVPEKYRRPVTNEVTGRHVGDAHPAVQAYRAYYAAEKRELKGRPATWTGREQPSWFDLPAETPAAFITEPVGEWGDIF